MDTPAQRLMPVLERLLATKLEPEVLQAPLIQAITKGTEAIVQRLLAAGAPFEAIWIKRPPPLTLAAGAHPDGAATGIFRKNLPLVHASQNSSRPPSSDGPGVQRRAKSPTGRKPGRQKRPQGPLQHAGQPISPSTGCIGWSASSVERGREPPCGLRDEVYWPSCARR